MTGALVRNCQFDCQGDAYSGDRNWHGSRVFLSSLRWLNARAALTGSLARAR